MFVMKKHEYPLSMNFVMNQPHSVSNDNMFVMVRHEAIRFVIYCKFIRVKASITTFCVV